MGKYRIIEFLQRNGVVYYCVQKKILSFLWLYITEVRDISMASYKKKYDTIEQAQEEIKAQINYTENKKNRKIVYKRIVSKY